MRRLSSVLLALALLLVTAIPALAAQPPRPDPLTIDCDGMVITVEFRHRGAGGIVAFHEGRPLLALGGTFEFVATDAENNVVFEDSDTFRMAKGIADDRFMRCSFGETFEFTDPELGEGELTGTFTANLLVFRPGR
jgi:hypothetical protein